MAELHSVDHAADQRDSVEHPERHEHSDVSIRGIWITAAALIGTAIVVHVLLYFVFFAYESAHAKEDKALRRTAFDGLRQEPPPGVPRLQGIAGYHSATPSVDLLKMNEENRAILNGYGPTTRPGVVRIPVARAIDIALEKNMFPARAPATQPGGERARP